MIDQAFREFRKVPHTTLSIDPWHNSIDIPSSNFWESQEIRVGDKSAYVGQSSRQQFVSVVGLKNEGSTCFCVCIFVSFQQSLYPITCASYCDLSECHVYESDA